MKTRNLIVMLLAIAMMLTSMIGASAEVVELPRNETLYFAGQQWGSVNTGTSLAPTRIMLWQSPAALADTAP